MKRNLLAVLVVMVALLAGAVSAEGADVYTTTDFMSGVAGGYSYHNTYYTFDFTVDGLPNENAYILGISLFPDDEVYVNVAGYNIQDGGSFILNVYGESEYNPFPVLELYVIVDGGDGVLFYTDRGVLTLGSEDDTVLTSDNISFDGGDFGNIGAIQFMPGQVAQAFDSIVIDTTVPEPASMSLLAVAGIAVLRRRRILS